jgi:hypothetical protein
MLVGIGDGDDEGVRVGKAVGGRLDDGAAVGVGVGNVDGRVTAAVGKGVCVVGTGLGGGVSAMVKGSEYTSSELSTSCTRNA